MNIDANTRERGHSIKPEPALLEVIPKLYATDEVPLEDKMVYVHYFVGKCDWLLMELNQEPGEEQWLGFGWCDLGQGYPELGYFSLLELAGVVARGQLWTIKDEGVDKGSFPLYVERDLHFTPRKFSEVRHGS